MMPLVIEKASGGIAIMRLVGDADEATCIEQWKGANPGEYVAHAEIAEDALPSDRTDRQTWALVDGAVVLDPSLTPVPQVVTMRQARRALLGAGKLAAVETAINAMPEPDKSEARIDWDRSQEVRRDWPLVAALAPTLGLTDAQIDQLFITAATL